MDKLRLRHQVNKITENNINPAPMYILNELNQACDNVETCRTIEDMLLKRIEKNQVHVTIKALKALRFFCQRGQQHARRELQRKTEKIRDCIGYRGPPDALHGESLNKQVRELGQEVMTLIFDESPSMAASPQASISTAGFGGGMGGGGGSGGYVDGFGGGGGGNGGMGGGRSGGAPSPIGTGKVMQGVGNPMYDNRPRPDAHTNSDKARRLAQQGLNVLGNQVNAFAAKYSGQSGTMPLHQSSTYDAPHKQSQQYAPQSPAPSQQFSSPSPSRVEPMGGASSWGAPQRSAPRAKLQREDAGEYETMLVDGITATGGAGTRPTKAALKDFCQACTALDSDIVGGLLADKLEDAMAPWQTKLKALCAIEALSAQMSGIRDYFSDEGRGLGSVQANLTSVQTSIQSQAKKLLSKLNVQSASAAPSELSLVEMDSEEASVASPSPTSLGLFNGISTPAPSTPAPSTPAPSTPSGLFSGLASTSDSKAAAAPSPSAPPPQQNITMGSLLDFGDEQAATPAPADTPSSGSNELHALLGLADLPATAAPGAGANIHDVIASMQQQNPPVTAAPSASIGIGMPEGISTGGSPMDDLIGRGLLAPTPCPAPAPAPVSQDVSGFGFMSSSPAPVQPQQMSPVGAMSSMGEIAQPAANRPVRKLSAGPLTTPAQDAFGFMAANEDSFGFVVEKMKSVTTG